MLEIGFNCTTLEKEPGMMLEDPTQKWMKGFIKEGLLKKNLEKFELEQPQPYLKNHHSGYHQLVGDL